jgi:hypothetical protein
MVDEYDCMLEAEIVCPWCGHRHSDSYEYIPDNWSECTELDCEECEQTIELTVVRDVRYTTKRKQ